MSRYGVRGVAGRGRAGVLELSVIASYRIGVEAPYLCRYSTIHAALDVVSSTLFIAIFRYKHGWCLVRESARKLIGGRREYQTQSRAGCIALGNVYYNLPRWKVSS